MSSKSARPLLSMARASLTRLANTTARAALRDTRGVLEAAVRYASIYDPARFLAEGMVST